MVPRHIRRVTDLPLPQLSKQMLNACPISPIHIMVRLLPGHQSSILLTMNGTMT